MDELKFQNQLRIVQTSLQISEKGDLKLSGKFEGGEIQSILDASHLKSNQYYRHEERLSRDQNLMSIFYGICISSVLGLFFYSVFNLKTQPQPQPEAYINVKSIVS